MDIIKKWITLASEGRISDGGKPLSPEECQLILRTLQLIAAEMEFGDPASS